MEEHRSFLTREANADGMSSRKRSPYGPLQGLQDPAAAGEGRDRRRHIPRSASVPPILDCALLLEIFLVLVEEAILQSVGAVRAGCCLARSLVFLNRLVQAVELAKQRHVQLAEANLYLS